MEFNPNFVNIFIKNNQVSYLGQLLFYIFAIAISVIILFFCSAPNSNEQFLICFLAPFIGLVFYLTNISFQSLIQKITNSILLRYLGALIAIELLLFVFVLLGAEDDNKLVMRTYINNRLSVLGFVFINLPSVLNNLLSFFIELWHSQRSKNHILDSNLLDDNFDHNKNNNENGA